MGRFKDLSGQRFDRLTVVERAEKTGGAVRWLCRCDCGNEKEVQAGNLTSGQVRSCGCLQRESVDVPDMTGLRFGRLTGIARAGVDSTRSALWLFRCDCGKEVVIPGTRVRLGAAKSCGCQRSDSARATHLKHGMARTPPYQRWLSIKQRCRNPKDPSYPRYGGRGIDIYDEWFDSFEAFFQYVGEPPEPHLTLDRIDNNGNYEPGNVRWATHSVQMKNRRPYKRATHAMIDERDAEIERLKAIIAGSKTSP